MFRFRFYFLHCWQIILWLPPPVITDLFIPDRSINPVGRDLTQIRRLTAVVIGPGIGTPLRNGRGGIAPIDISNKSNGDLDA